MTMLEAHANSPALPALTETTRILVAVALFLALVATATATWGLAGLAMSALACVPVMFVVLMLITVGK